MGAWETVLAAAGGLVLGMGLGLAVARTREHTLLLRLRRAQTRLRAAVVPVLEARAQALGIPAAERDRHGDDPLGRAVGLSTAIQRVERHPDLAFSDTVELARAELGAGDRRGSRYGSG